MDQSRADLPLAGITVVSMEQAVAAPYATRQLADLGARVIKIERPGGGDFARAYDASVLGMSSYFAWLNRSKESLGLDVKSPQGREVLDRLLETADVFLHNLAPGAADRLGVGVEQLRTRFPRLIACEITGYGHDGPWAERKAYDLMVQSEAGFLSVTGTPEDPAKAGISIADIAAGMYAYSGVLTALLHRWRTGEIRAVRLSLFESLAEWMQQPALYARYGGTVPRRAGASHATIAPYGPFPTRDGQVVLAVQSDREWVTFRSRVMADDPRLEDIRFATNAGRVANRAELDAVVGERTALLTSAEVVTLAESGGIAYASINDMSTFFDHPVLRGRDRWRDVETPGGTIEQLLPPASIEGMVPSMGPVPACGESTDAILAEFGYTLDEAGRPHPAAPADRPNGSATG